MDKESVNHPEHYNSNPSGVECITVVEHMNFCLGNAMKYIWRAGEKGKTTEDIRKAIWYLKRELERTDPLKYDPSFMMDEETLAWKHKAEELAKFMKIRGFTSLGPININ